MMPTGKKTAMKASSSVPNMNNQPTVTANKPAPIKPGISPTENETLLFFIDQIGDKMNVTLSMLAARMSALSAEQRKYIGTGQEGLKKFIQRHSDVFTLQGNNVFVKLQYVLNTTDPVKTSCLQSSSATGLRSVMCRVSGVFNGYGFAETDTEEKIYFGSNVFEKGQHPDIQEVLTIGDLVVVDAVVGCPSDWAKWRATSVERFRKSSFSTAVPASIKDIRLTGKLCVVMQNFAVISWVTGSTGYTEFVYFAREIFASPQPVNSLTSILTVGTIVSFKVDKAPTGLPLSWYAVEVWTEPRPAAEIEMLTLSQVHSRMMSDLKNIELPKIKPRTSLISNNSFSSLCDISSPLSSSVANDDSSSESSIESSSSAEKLDVDTEIVKFLQERVKRKGGSITLQCLTGHLSALPPHIRDRISLKLDDLRVVILKHQNYFRLVGDTVSLLKSSTDSVKTDTAAKVENAVRKSQDNIKTTVNISTSRNIPTNESLREPSLKKPEIIVPGYKGKVINLTDKFGVIAYGTDGIYFTKETVVPMDEKPFDSLHQILSLNDEIICDAVLGDPKYKYKYRALRVIVLEEGDHSEKENDEDFIVVGSKPVKRNRTPSPERSAIINSRPSQENGVDEEEVYVSGDEWDDDGLYNQKGIVAKLLPTAGFIKRGSNYKDPENVYFNNMCFYDGKRTVTVTDLRTVLREGEEVRYNAKVGPDNASCKWRATIVWKEASQDILRHHLNDHIIDPSQMLRNKKGKIVKIFPCKGIIAFGPHPYHDRVFFTVDIFYNHNRPVDSLIKALNIGDLVYFSACVDDPNMKTQWKATLVWTGDPPNEVSDHSANRAPLNIKPSSSFENRSSTELLSKMSKVISIFPMKGIASFGPLDHLDEVFFTKDNFYYHGTRVQNMAYKLKVGDTIFIDAVPDVPGMRTKWIAKLAWVGERPKILDTHLPPMISSSDSKFSNPFQISHPVFGSKEHDNDLDQLKHLETLPKSISNDNFFSKEGMKEAKISLPSTTSQYSLSHISAIDTHSTLFDHFPPLPSKQPNTDDSKLIKVSSDTTRASPSFSSQCISPVTDENAFPEMKLSVPTQNTSVPSSFKNSSIMDTGSSEPTNSLFPSYSLSTALSSNSNNSSGSKYFSKSAVSDLNPYLSYLNHNTFVKSSVSSSLVNIKDNSVSMTNAIGHHLQSNHKFSNPNITTSENAFPLIGSPLFSAPSINSPLPSSTTVPLNSSLSLSTPSSMFPLPSASVSDTMCELCESTSVNPLLSGQINFSQHFSSSPVSTPVISSPRISSNFAPSFVSDQKLNTFTVATSAVSSSTFGTEASSMKSSSASNVLKDPQYSNFGALDIEHGNRFANVNFQNGSKIEGCNNKSTKPEESRSSLRFNKNIESLTNSVDLQPKLLERKGHNFENTNLDFEIDENEMYASEEEFDFASESTLVDEEYASEGEFADVSGEELESEIHSRLYGHPKLPKQSKSSTTLNQPKKHVLRKLRETEGSLNSLSNDSNCASKGIAHRPKEELCADITKQLSLSKRNNYGNEESAQNQIYSLKNASNSNISSLSSQSANKECFGADGDNNSLKNIVNQSELIVIAQLGHYEKPCSGGGIIISYNSNQTMFRTHFSTDVLFVHGVQGDSQHLLVGETLNFNAYKLQEPCDWEWEATLVWIGKKPKAGISQEQNADSTISSPKDDLENGENPSKASTIATEDASSNGLLRPDSSIPLDGKGLQDQARHKKMDSLKENLQCLLETNVETSKQIHSAQVPEGLTSKGGLNVDLKNDSKETSQMDIPDNSIKNAQHVDFANASMVSKCSSMGSTDEDATSNKFADSNGDGKISTNHSSSDSSHSSEPNGGKVAQSIPDNITQDKLLQVEAKQNGNERCSSGTLSTEVTHESTSRDAQREGAFKKGGGNLSKEVVRSKDPFSTGSKGQNSSSSNSNSPEDIDSELADLVPWDDDSPEEKWIQLEEEALSVCNTKQELDILSMELKELCDETLEDEDFSKSASEISIRGPSESKSSESQTLNQLDLNILGEMCEMNTSTKIDNEWTSSFSDTDLSKGALKSQFSDTATDIHLPKELGSLWNNKPSTPIDGIPILEDSVKHSSTIAPIGTSSVFSKSSQDLKSQEGSKISIMPSDIAHPWMSPLQLSCPPLSEEIINTTYINSLPWKDIQNPELIALRHRYQETWMQFFTAHHHLMKYLQGHGFDLANELPPVPSGLQAIQTSWPMARNAGLATTSIPESFQDASSGSKPSVSTTYVSTPTQTMSTGDILSGCLYFDT